MSQELAMAIVELKRDKAMELVKSRAEKGEDPLSILAECRDGMTIVGDRFQAGDYYLAELLLSGEIFKAVIAFLEPYLAKARPAKPLGKVVLATVRGDIHDLGKNILSVLLRAQGFEVHDLGVDVAPAKIVETVREVQPDFVGFSALITTSFPAMKEVGQMLVEAGLREKVKLMVGGGVTTQALKDYVGADFQTIDATAGVTYCLQNVERR
jgi:methylmalonyl-CoA mutase cobalamin-binding domain/chain